MTALFVVLVLVLAVLLAGPFRKVGRRFWPFTLCAVPGLFAGYLLGSWMLPLIPHHVPWLPLLVAAMTAVAAGQWGWSLLGWMAKGKWPEDR